MKFKLSLKPPFILYNDTLCECGEHKKCLRKINASNNGRLWVENKDHFRCGKVRNQIEKLKDMNYSARGCMYCEGVCNKECLPKQETLEEESERESSLFYEKGSLDWNKYRQVFIEGAKWQQQRSYSEEDMRKAYSIGWITRERFDDLSPDIVYPKGLDYEEKQDYAFNLWFEQIKKK